MSGLYWFTDEQMTRLQPHFPGAPAMVNRPSVQQ